MKQSATSSALDWIDSYAGPNGCLWAFAEFTDVWTIESEFAGKVTAWLDGVGEKQT